MAREKFEERLLSGNINVACKFDDGSVRYWSTKKETVVQHIRQIVNEYAAEGYVLTLRQLHYQLVTQNWIVNHDTAYKKLGSILDDCRYGGVIDWNAIEDRGRVPYIPYSVEDIDDALQDTIDQYRLNRQEGQSNLVELWTEKDALSGILKRTTSKYHIRLVVNKGYTSSSALYNAYHRILEALVEGKKFTILYFGDHDPSGLDMVRDISERLLFFLSRGDNFFRTSERVLDWWEQNKYTIYDVIEWTGNDKIAKLLHQEDDLLADEFEAGRIMQYIKQHDLFKIIPIGLTMEQIRKYKLPANPTKLTDSRAEKYIKKYGKTCWEVDALKPQTLTSIVEENIKKQINVPLYNSVVQQEAIDIEKIKSFFDNREN